MWAETLRNWLRPPKKPRVFRTIDFTLSTKEYWARFDGGDNNDARFAIYGDVALGDEILVRMQSGRIGRYRIFSLLWDFSGVAQWKVRAVGRGYWEPVGVVKNTTPSKRPKIKGLLGDGTRWVRSSSGELAHLPSGFTKSASEFWTILARTKADRERTDSMRSTSNL